MTTRKMSRLLLLCMAACLQRGPTAADALDRTLPMAGSASSRLLSVEGRRWKAGASGSEGLVASTRLPPVLIGRQLIGLRGGEGDGGRGSGRDEEDPQNPRRQGVTQEGEDADNPFGGPNAGNWAGTDACSGAPPQQPSRRDTEEEQEAQQAPPNPAHFVRTGSYGMSRAQLQASQDSPSPCPPAPAPFRRTASFGKGEHMPKVDLQEVHGTEQPSQAQQQQQQQQHTQPPAQHHGGVPAQDAHQPHSHQQGEKLHGARYVRTKSSTMGVGMSHTDRPGRWVYLTGGAAVVNPPLPLLPGQTSEEIGKIWQDEGWGTRNATQLCYRFDNGPGAGREEEWVDQSGFASNMTHARAAHASAVYQGRCIVAGGWDNDYKTMDSVEWHHPYLDQWTELGSLFIPRHLFGLVCLESQLYAVGGFDHHGNMIRYVEKYDPTDNTWDEEADMNLGRGAMAVCALNGRIYAASGWRGAKQAGEGPKTWDGKPLEGYEEYVVTAECEAFDPATHEWTFVSPMHQARAQAACCVFEGEMWVAGGFDVGHNMTSSVESYNPVTDIWTRRPNLPTELQATSLTVMQGPDGPFLCTFGGFYHDTDIKSLCLKTSFRLDKERGEWVYNDLAEAPFECFCHQAQLV